MANNHKSTIEIPIPLYDQAKKYSINVSEASRNGIRKEIERHQIMEKIERGELRLETIA